MSTGSSLAPDAQVVLELFGRLSDEDKRAVLGRLIEKGAPPDAERKPLEPETLIDDDLDWGEITEEDHDRLAAEAFAEIEREEEEYARGRRRQSG